LQETERHERQRDVVVLCLLLPALAVVEPEELLAGSKQRLRLTAEFGCNGIPGWEKTVAA